jgi:hypothetical protein
MYQEIGLLYHINIRIQFWLEWDNEQAALSVCVSRGILNKESWAEHILREDVVAVGSNSTELNIRPA